MNFPILLPDDYDAPKAALTLAVDLAKAQAAAAYSDDAKRIARAATLVLDGNVAVHDDGTATVKSGSSDKVYTLNGHCTCEATTFHGTTYRCAHRWAKSLLKRAAQHLDNLWYATYMDAAGIVYETGKDLWAFFMAGQEGYVEVHMADPHLVVCGHCPEVIEQAQADAYTALRCGR